MIYLFPLPSLWKLAHRAAINSNVKLIALPQPNYVVKPGTTCSMAGWGMTGLGKKTNVLQEVDLKMGDQKQREEKDDLFNSATMIFTGDEKDHKPPFEVIRSPPTLFPTRQLPLML